MSVIEVRNPRNGKFDYSFEPVSTDEVAGICQKIRHAQQHWWSAGFEYRQRALMRWKDEVDKRMDQIVDALIQDTGRQTISREEVGVIGHLIEGQCHVAPMVLKTPEGQSSSNPEITFENQYVPYSVVGIISPWNFPLVLSFLDIVPALVAGCGGIIKPSEITPRFVEPLQASINAVPELAAVLRLVQGAEETGQAILDNVDAVVFTGSIATGSKVAQTAAKNFIPAFLELGGKDPAVILEGSDLERAATATIRSSIYNAGQVCYAIERVYVDERVHDEFVAIVMDQIKDLDINYPDINQGQVGPLIFEKQALTIKEQLEDAVAKGAEILSGGEIEQHDGGVWIRPTVVVNVTHDMKLMTDETFGPILPIMKFKTEDEAVELANDTRYGLSGAVFSNSIEKSTEIARRINAGGISVNDTELPRAIMMDAEKMAFNKSGIGGSRYGVANMLRYTRKKAIIKNPGATNSLEVLNESTGN